MKTLLAIITISIASISFAGEDIPDFDAILAETNTKIDLPSFEIEAPKANSELQGLVTIQKDRTSESIAETVRKNQSRLTNTYKTWTIKKGISINRLYDLSLTIDKDGNITKVGIKGPSDKEYIKEISEIVKTWQFEKVSNPTPKMATLRNLDFNYRTELVME